MSDTSFRHVSIAEYVKACKDGDLYAADEATAKACGVSFDPTFGALAKAKGSASNDKPAAQPAEKG